MIDYGAKTASDWAILMPKVVKSTNVPVYTGDTLFVPEDLWGFKTANSYNLHLVAALLIYQNHYEHLHNNQSDSSNHFFLSSGYALRKALRFITSLEKKDTILESLLIRSCLLNPHIGAIGNVVPYRDRHDRQLRFFSIARAALGYRCDSTMWQTWMHSHELPSFALVSANQLPSGINKGYEIDAKIINKGTISCPIIISAVLSNGYNKFITVAPFTADTVIRFGLDASLLKVVLDPHYLLMEDDVSDNQVVSDEFIRKRRVFSMFALFAWNIISSFISYAILFIVMLFVRNIFNAFLKNHRYLLLAWFALFVIVKLSLPSILFGFNIWGFYYYLHYSFHTIQIVWLIASAFLSAAIVYYISTREEENFSKQTALMQWMIMFSFVEPLFSGVKLFF